MIWVTGHSELHQAFNKPPRWSDGSGKGTGMDEWDWVCEFA